jgi:hypothetical protein
MSFGLIFNYLNTFMIVEKNLSTYYLPGSIGVKLYQWVVLNVKVTVYLGQKTLPEKGLYSFQETSTHRRYHVC